MLTRKLIHRACYYLLAARTAGVQLFKRLQGRSAKHPLIVFDPALQGYHGHHLEFARLIKRELAGAFDLNFYAHYQAANRIVVEFPACPICYASIYPPRGDFRTVYAQQHESMLASLRRINPRELSPQTIFLMHTLTVFQLGGLAEWHAALPSEQRPKLFLQFQFPLEYGVERASDWPAARAIARAAVAKLANAGTVYFGTNSTLLRDRLSEQLGQTWRLMPVPTRWPKHESPAPSPRKAVFGFYGGLRVEKGSRIVAEAVSAFAKRHADTHFIVHAPRSENDDIALRDLTTIPQVELIRKNFKDKDAYFVQLCRAHFILLPYDPEIYALRTSGVFVEALGLGRPVITTAGTWMAHELRQRSAAGFIMSAYSAEALCDCLEAARQTVVQRSWTAAADREIMAFHSTSAFATAVIGASQD